MQIEDTVGVIVARFHAPNLHPGHHFVISYVCERHANILVLLDVQRKYPDDHDPLSFEIREQMVRDAFGGRPVTIVPLVTRRHGYEVRSLQIDELIETHFPGQKAVIYGSRESVT